jgi:signal transduction histidine kinase
MRTAWLSLRARVVLAIALVALAPLLLVFAWSQVDRPVPGRLWTNVRDVMDASKAAAERHAPAAAFDQLAREHRVRLRVVGAGGEVRVDVDADRPTDALERLEAFFLRPASAPTLREIDDAMGPVLDRAEVRLAREHGPFVRCEYEGLLYCQAIATTSSGDAIVYVQQSSFRAVGAVYQLRAQLVRMSLLVWPLAALLAWFTGGRIVRPLQRLRARALARPGQPRGRGDELGREHPPGDEVGDLAAALDAAFGALEDERRAHEEFVADLVHELKSPAASVRACADALEDAPSSDDRTKRLARVLRDSSGTLESTVSRFMDLALAQAGFPREEREPVDLAAIARGVTASMTDDARFGDVVFEVDAPGPVLVLGVQHRLEAMLRELVDNGASFVGRGGHVVVRARVEGDRAVLRVEDDGPGISAVDLPNVFRRYYTTRGHARGSGLGLALVRAVAEAHGGQASALADRAKGAAFEVRLPRS